MRYPGAEKLEIIRLVEQSHLPVRRTLATLGILLQSLDPDTELFVGRSPHAARPGWDLVHHRP